MKKNFLSSSYAKEDVSGNVEVVMPDDVNLMSLNMWSYEIPFEVKCDGDWTIEITGDCFYVYPESGSGDAIVQICVLDNDSGVRQEGTLKAITNGVESSVVNIQQQCKTDCGSNAVAISVGNKVYAVGYGYDTRDQYASPSAVKLPIMQFSTMNAKGLINYGSVTANFSEKSVTGSSFAELSNNLNVKANASGSYFGFKGEVNASFNMSNYTSGTHEFAVTYADARIRDIGIDADIPELIAYMTPAAYNAINGKSSYYQGAEGIARLIDKYGTHMVYTCGLGGRLRFATSVDVSKVTGAYDLKSFASASYSTTGFSTSATIEDEFKKSYEKNKKSCSTEMSVLGGSQKSVNEMWANKNAASITNWKESLSEENMALVAFNDDSLIPIYELVNLNEEGGKKRRDEIIAYLRGSEFTESTKVNYDCGTVVKVTVPSFSTSSTTSLIKEVTIGGGLVATVCSEFIPSLSKTERVTVVYPQVNNKAMFNMGYFVGNSTHRPARVSWSGDDVTINEYKDEPLGAKSTLWIKGCVISAVKEAAEANGTITDSLLVLANINHYPLVKIMGKIWVRRNHSEKVASDGSATDYKYCSRLVGRAYKWSIIKKSVFAPTGWRVAGDADYQSVANMLSSYGLTPVGKHFRSGNNSPLGFEAPIEPNVYYWFQDGNGGCNNSGDQNEYVTPNHSHVRMTNSAFAVESIVDNYDGWYMTVRLVKG